MAVTIKVLLSGHTSPVTAYTVDDYPYGFRLRCKIRYWLEFTPKRGVRLWSQTTNPKRPGEAWNKPKASTYCKFGGAMFLDQDDHVQWHGLTEYTDASEAIAWRDQFGAANHPAAVALTDAWIKAKTAYEEKRRLAG